MSDVASTLSSLPRVAILHAAESARLQRLVQQHGKRVGAARFVAGETLDECVTVLRKLNDAGLYANTTLLGEAIPDAEGAAAVTAEYDGDHRAARRREAEGERRSQADAPRPQPSTRRSRTRTSSGSSHVQASSATFLRIDMEQSEYVDVTLRIYERLRDAGHESVGTVLQSYLYRTAGRPRAAAARERRTSAS